MKQLLYKNVYYYIWSIIYLDLDISPALTTLHGDIGMQDTDHKLLQYFLIENRSLQKVFFKSLKIILMGQ